MQSMYTDSLLGWSIGYQYAKTKNQEDEIKQGINFYLSTACVLGQLFQLGVIISKINEALPDHPLKFSVKVLSNLGPFLSIPSLVLCATVKQGDYDTLHTLYQRSGYNYIELPEKLEDRTVAVLSFFADHAGDIIRIAMVAGSVGLIALGKQAYGAAVLAAVGYEIIDRMGWVPRRISLFIECYMPTVSLIGSLIGGTLVIRAFSAIVLVTEIMPPFTKYIHHTVDALARYFFSIKAPSLVEIDAPVVKREKMTFDEIEEILNNSAFDYKINPAHCSQSTLNLTELPKDHDFTKYLTLFDSIEWESKYTLLKNKLKTDDRFIDFLFEKYPQIKKEDLANQIEDYIEELALEADVSPEEYVANWMEEQYIQLIAVLQGEKRVTGHQQDLDEAIELCAILLPYLESLEDPIELEDILLKLAVEAGDYCGRGIKRTVNELYWEIMQKGVESEENDDPVKNYEMKINQALQNKRYELILNLYEQMTKEVKIPDQIAQDTHGFDIYRLYFSLGFFPLTKFERRRLTMVEIGIWEAYRAQGMHNALYRGYQWELDDVIQEAGEAEFGVYMLQMINQNEQLSDKEKEEILDKFTERNNGKWSFPETLKKFHRLMLVRLGVLIAKTPEDLAAEE